MDGTNVSAAALHRGPQACDQARRVVQEAAPEGRTEQAVIHYRFKFFLSSSDAVYEYLHLLNKY